MGIEIPFEPQESVDSSDDKEVNSKADQETITYTRKKANRGRNIDTSKLARETVVHDLSEEEKQCGDCQQSLVCIGKDKSEKLEYIPAQLKVVEHVRPKYSCRQCDTVIAAKKDDEVIPKSMAGTSLLKHQ